MARILSDVQLRKSEQQVMEYLKVYPTVTNREMRVLSGLSYDQCINLFSFLVDSKKLKRVGKGAGTHYTLVGAFESEV